MHPNEIRLVSRSPEGKIGPTEALARFRDYALECRDKKSPFSKALQEQVARQTRLLESGWVDLGAI